MNGGAGEAAPKFSSVLVGQKLITALCGHKIITNAINISRTIALVLAKA